MPPPLLATLVLNYNRSGDTEACLESLLKGQFANHEIVVIDNGSTDDSAKKLVAWAARRTPTMKFNIVTQPDQALPSGALNAASAPQLTLIPIGSNRGFAGGNNVGIRYALKRGTKWMLLLNNDTVVEPSALSTLVDGAEQAGADMAGGAIYLHAEPSFIWYAGGKFGWWREKMITAPAMHSSAIVKTDWITGCCLLVRREVFGRIGLLDERAFLYFEDVDFSRRAARAGLRRAVVLDARIYHKVSSSSGPDSPFMWYHFSKSRLYFHRKHHSLLSHGLFLLLYFASRLGRMLLWMAQGRRDLIRVTFPAIRDAYAPK